MPTSLRDGRRVRKAAGARLSQVEIGAKIKKGNTMSATTWNFTIALLQGAASAGGLQPARTGTLQIETTDTLAVVGSLSIPDYLPQALQLSGPPPQPESPAGLAVSLAGSVPMFDCSILCSFVSDGFQYDTTYIGGTVGIYDRGAEEQLVYLLQGSSGQYRDE